MSTIMGETVLVTGGAGFIGSHLVERLIASDYQVINVDLLTYAGNTDNLEAVANNGRYKFVHGNIGDKVLMSQLLATFKPRLVMNLAAESHVDRSIDDGAQFIETNITAVYNLLYAALAHWRVLPAGERDRFRFVHMSTDEVYGSIADGEFTEESAYYPNSPYAASKASGDHLVRSFRVTYGLPTLIARASNTYGPRQFPEKLIPHTIISALNGKPLPIYGSGQNVRDWMHVHDLAAGLAEVAKAGVPAEEYNFAGGQTRANVDTVRYICSCMNARIPGDRPFESAIQFVDDRPGHDLRYAMSSEKVKRVFGWTPRITWENGLRSTVDWYLDNRKWWLAVLERGYKPSRIGLGSVA